MKNLSIIVALMITLSTNAQARLGSKSQDICEEFNLTDANYFSDPEVGLFLKFFPDPNVIVSYFLDKDSMVSYSMPSISICSIKSCFFSNLKPSIKSLIDI